MTYGTIVIRFTHEGDRDPEPWNTAFRKTDPWIQLALEAKQRDSTGSRVYLPTGKMILRLRKMSWWNRCRNGEEENELIRAQRSTGKYIEERLITAYTRIRKNARNGLPLCKSKGMPRRMFYKIPPSTSLISACIKRSSFVILWQDLVGWRIVNSVHYAFQPPKRQSMSRNRCFSSCFAFFPFSSFGQLTLTTTAGRLPIHTFTAFRSRQAVNIEKSVHPPNLILLSWKYHRFLSVHRKNHPHLRNSVRPRKNRSGILKKGTWIALVPVCLVICASSMPYAGWNSVSINRLPWCQLRLWCTKENAQLHPDFLYRTLGLGWSMSWPASSRIIIPGLRILGLEGNVQKGLEEISVMAGYEGNNETWQLFRTKPYYTWHFLHLFQRLHQKCRYNKASSWTTARSHYFLISGHYGNLFQTFLNVPFQSQYPEYPGIIIRDDAGQDMDQPSPEFCKRKSGCSCAFSLSTP